MVRQVKKGDARPAPRTPGVTRQPVHRSAPSVGWDSRARTTIPDAPARCRCETAEAIRAPAEKATAFDHRRIPPRIVPGEGAFTFAAFVVAESLRNFAADFALLTGLRSETTGSPGPRSPPRGFEYLDKITSNRLKAANAARSIADDEAEKYGVTFPQVRRKAPRPPGLADPLARG